ncbi:MAG: hypothetical protein BWY74_03750 [Firmicutes bacterium ADurb.Bin419]|nr:MAG: hypothetical protein BWY74_03750 [Firmicutes bacterium ADurb.Bin419]
MIYINILAILISPIVALLLTKYLQNRKEVRERQYNVFITLVSSRHKNIDHEQAKAFNSIDIVFHNCEGVRKSWKEYFELIHQPNRISEWDNKRLELLKAMSDVVGYKNIIDHLDLGRVYSPVGLTEEQATQKRLAESMISFFESNNPKKEK